MAISETSIDLQVVDAKDSTLTLEELLRLSSDNSSAIFLTTHGVIMGGKVIADVANLEDFIPTSDASVNPTANSIVKRDNNGDVRVHGIVDDTGNMYALPYSSAEVKDNADAILQMEITDLNTIRNNAKTAAEAIPDLEGDIEQLQGVTADIVTIRSNAAKVTTKVDRAEVEEMIADVEARNKGYFISSSSLIASYPTGTVGDRAYVGITAPFAIYEWNGSAWVDTGQTGGSDEVDLSGTYPNMTVGFAENASILENIDISNALNGYYNVYSSPSLTFASSSSFKSILITVSSGERYIYEGVLGGNAMAAIMLADIDGNVVSVIDRGSSEKYNTSVYGDVTIPEGVRQMAFCWMVKSGANISLSRIKATPLSEVVEGVERFNQFEEEFIIPASPNLWNGETIDKVISSSGSLTVVSSWSENKSSVLIPVQPNAYYYLSGRSSKIQTRAIRCVDSGGVSPMKVLAPANGVEYKTNWYLPNSDGSNGAVDGMFKTPSNAAFVQFVVSTATGTDFSQVMLEYVGTEYDANFTPSAYQPYDPTEVINPERLPLHLEETAESASARRFPLKVLLIGSSHGMNTISQFPWIAYKSGFNVTVGNVYKGSLTLQQVATAITNNAAIGGWFKVFRNGAWVTDSSTLFDDVITEERWDYVIIQRSASDDTTWTTEQATALDTIIERIIAKSVGTPRILFNSGFPDPTASVDGQRTQWESIMDSARNMQATYQIGIIPMATAIVNARTTLLANIGYYTRKQLCYDSQHLDYGIGCYVCGVTLFEYILKDFGWSCLTAKGYATYEEAASFEVTVDYDGITSSAYTEPTAQTMTIAKYCAMAAVREPDTISSTLSEKYPL